MKLVLVLLCLSFFSLAQEGEEIDSLSLPPDEKPNAEESALGKKPDQVHKKGKDNVGAILDFEGEIIEGERRRPDLFLQISIDNVKFDSLIYNRDDFNDYLEVDRKSRNKFFKMK